MPAVIVALAIVFGSINPNFWSATNLANVSRQMSILALLSLGQTFAILSGGIDLSVGSVVALVTVTIAASLKAGVAPWTALFIGLGAGVVSGLLNGALVTKLKVGPFIVTLGTLLVIRGIAKGISHENSIYPPDSWLNDLLARLSPAESWKLVPIGVWLTLVFAILVSLLMRRTRFGRHIVAIGSNEAAARLCGVPVGRVRLAVYVLGGLFFGLAGLMQFSRLTVGDPTAATGLELDVIAAVVIGGASLAGGQGSILGSLLGAFIMTTISAGCAQMSYPNWVQQIVTGTIIIGAVALDKLRVKSAAV